MTTLPQTTVRLPRPPSAFPSSIGPALVAAQPSAPANQMSGADVWRVLRANIWLILMMLVIGTVFGYLANLGLKKYFASYTTTAVVAVSAPVQTDPLKVGQVTVDLQILTMEQKKNAQRLKLPQLYSEVLQNEASPIRDTTWIKQFATTAAAQKDLIDYLVVTPALDTVLIHVEMSTRDPEDGKKIIDSVVNQLMTDESSEAAQMQAERRVRLTAMRQGKEQRRTELLDDMHDKQSRLNISVLGSGRLNVKETAMADLTRDKNDAELKSAMAQETYNRIATQMKENTYPPAVLQVVNADPLVQRYRDLVNNLDLEILRQTNLGPESTELKQYSQEKDLINKKLTQAMDDVKSSTGLMYLEQARQEMESSKLTVDRLNAEIVSLDTEIQALNKDLGDYETEKDELDKIEADERLYDEQLTEIDNFTSQKDQTNLQWISFPEASEIPTFPKLPVVMSMSIALALALALGIAFLREIMDTTVRSPRDITRVGSMTMLGIIPHEDDDPQARGTRLPLVIFEAPQSMMAEQLRQVRTRLQHAASLDTTRTILITSPSPDDGKSTIAANLASGLALNGRRILLVDANFRRPSVHRMFNVANDLGFSDVLNKLDTFESAVQETQVPNLYVLPSGPKPSNATELLESQLLLDFNERALEEFDHVIFDSGPLLLVSETAALAPRVDGVVTVVRARTNTRGLLQRLRDQLRQIKAENLGVVLNAVRSQGGGYYRSNIRTHYDYQNGHSD